jgi:hypothetical protein
MVSNVQRPGDSIAINKDLTSDLHPSPIGHRIDHPSEKRMKHTTKNFPVPLSATASRRFVIALGLLSRDDQCLSTKGHDATK